MTAHIPALQTLYRLVAVSPSLRESAEGASRTFGVPAFDNHEALIAHPDWPRTPASVKLSVRTSSSRFKVRFGKSIFLVPFRVRARYSCECMQAV